MPHVGAWLAPCGLHIEGLVAITVVKNGRCEWCASLRISGNVVLWHHDVMIGFLLVQTFDTRYAARTVMVIAVRPKTIEIDSDVE